MSNGYEVRPSEQEVVEAALREWRLVGDAPLAHVPLRSMEELVDFTSGKFTFKWIPTPQSEVSVVPFDAHRWRLLGWLYVAAVLVMVSVALLAFALLVLPALCYWLLKSQLNRRGTGD